MALKTKTLSKALRKASTSRYHLHDGKAATVHVAEYDLKRVRLRVEVFSQPVRLLDWCENNNQAYAINGGFFVRESQKPLGELWQNGIRHDTPSFSSGWNKKRGAVYSAPLGGILLDYFHSLPKVVEGDLLQAGPLLIKNKKVLIKDLSDPEGFSAHSYQFDSDITDGRYPRAGLATNDKSLFLVVCDGRVVAEAGLTLHEFAEFMSLELGAHHALNLDGGSSSSLVCDFRLINKPRSPDKLFERGRPVHTALVVEPL